MSARTKSWKAKDHFDPKSPMIPVALSGGVTSMITRPGSGIISSGQSVAVKLKSDPTKNMILKPFVDLKMAVRPLIRLLATAGAGVILGNSGSRSHPTGSTLDVPDQNGASWVGSARRRHNRALRTTLGM